MVPDNILILVVEKVRNEDRTMGAARGASARVRGAAARKDRAIEAIATVTGGCREVERRETEKKELVEG